MRITKLFQAKAFYISGCLLTFFNLGFPQWNPSSVINTSICTSIGDQASVDIISDTKGGAIIAWVDSRNSSILSDIFVQRVNALGVTLWTANGISICSESSNQASLTITEDGAGGAFLVWNDFRNGDRDIYAQSIDSLGQARWSTDGVPVCIKSFDQQSPKVRNDGAGGAIVVWEDSTAANEFDIYAQKLSSTGTQAWATGGIPICSAVNTQANPKIESDSAGGGIIVWQDKRNGTDNDIYCQRINNSGVVQWTTDGVLVATAIYSQKNPKIKSDLQGGAIMCWQDARNNGIDSSGIFAQRVNASGQMQWTANGVAVCTAIGGQAQHDMTVQGVNGAIIAWRDKRSGVSADIYAQKLDMTGAASWAQNGVPVCVSTLDQESPSICSDCNGGAIICWEDVRNGFFDIYSQRMNSNGAAAWTLNGVVVGTAADDQLNSKNISDDNGGSIYGWEDLRNGSDLNVYAHHLFQDGNAALSLDENRHSKPVNAIVFPNPVKENSQLMIKNYVMTGNKMELKIVNPCGQIVSKKEFTGPITNLETEGLPNGLYGIIVESSNGLSVSGIFVVSRE